MMKKNIHLQGLRPWHLYFALRNRIDYPLRNYVAWKRPLPERQAPENAALLSDFPITIKNQALSLMQSFHLDDQRLFLTTDDLVVNLYYLDALQQVFSAVDVDWGESMHTGDVGPSDWFYLPGLYHFIRYYKCPQGREVCLEGFEIDPYRVYANLHSRYDYACHRSKAFPMVRYHPLAFQEQPEQFDMLIQFFPFLFLKDHLAWGLPGTMFNPRGLFQGLLNSLKKGGHWIILNQGEAEHGVQMELIEECGLQILTQFELRSVFKQYQKKHWMMVIKK
jgi:hypothetical protein